ncbi:unnamed protein product [Polarella glacialis]|uniref:CCHC-type domain-containing protein n=1 Tax=Polarella glacialis TaxID=89957 RepID=A0A813DLX3_POLGL|nr:unnamed protein product [Polarella glacialis]
MENRAARPAAEKAGRLLRCRHGLRGQPLRHGRRDRQPGPQRRGVRRPGPRQGVRQPGPRQGVRQPGQLQGVRRPHHSSEIADATPWGSHQHRGEGGDIFSQRRRGEGGADEPQCQLPQERDSRYLREQDPLCQPHHEGDPRRLREREPRHQPLCADGSDTDDGYDYSLSEPLGSSDTPSDCEDPLDGNYGFIGMMDGPEQPHPDGLRPSDLLKLGRPSLFSGKSDEWPDCVFSFRSFMHLTEMLDSKEMRAVEKHTATIPQSAVTDADKSRSTRLRYLLAVLLRGRTLQILRATEPGAGFEAWRLLCHEFEWKDEISAAGLLQAILSFSFDCELGSVMAKLAEFDVLVQAYDSQSSPDGLPDSVKRAVVVKSLPEPLRTQLQLTHPDSYSELRSVIDDFCRAKAVWRSSTVTGRPVGAGEVPMEVDVFGQDDSDIIGDIDAFGQSKGKGKGKTRTPRQERPTFNPECRTFDGYCSYCGFFGHGARECRRKAQEQGSELPLPARQTGGQQQQKQAKGKGIGKGRIHEVGQDILQEGEQILGVFEHEDSDATSYNELQQLFDQWNSGGADGPVRRS